MVPSKGCVLGACPANIPTLGWTAQLCSLRPYQGFLLLIIPALLVPQRAWSWEPDSPLPSGRPSSRWQDLWSAALRATTTLFKNLSQQLPARRTARLGPAG